MRLTCSPFDPASATRQVHLRGLPDRRMHRLRCYTQPTAPTRPRRPDARRGDRLQPQHAPRGAQDPTTHCERPSTGVLTERLRTFDTRVRLSGVAIGAQIGFALAGFAPAMTSAVRDWTKCLAPARSRHLCGPRRCIGRCLDRSGDAHGPDARSWKGRAAPQRDGSHLGESPRRIGTGI